MPLHKSKGVIRYDIYDQVKYKLDVVIDQGICDFYRALIPKWIATNKQYYLAHISVVRKETPVNLSTWNKYEGHEIEFYYDTTIHYDRNYFWLNVFCKQLEDIREELGLPRTSEITKPPSGWDWCFHTTIANTKGLNASYT